MSAPLPGSAVQSLREHGVDVLSSAGGASFEDGLYEIATADHFWLQWRLKAILGLLTAHEILPDRELRALDIGGGAGVFRTQAESATRWTVDLADLNPSALLKADPGRGRTLYYDILQPDPQLTGRYDLVFVLDVIEHLSDPATFLEAAGSHLAPGGCLVANVPALEACRSRFDDVVGHLRRYDKPQLSIVAAKAGLKDLEMRYWGLSMVPLLQLRKLMLARLSNKDDILDRGFRPPGHVSSAVLKALLRLETRLLPSPPLGSSLLLLASRPGVA